MVFDEVSFAIHRRMDLTFATTLPELYAAMSSNRIRE